MNEISNKATESHVDSFIQSNETSKERLSTMDVLDNPFSETEQFNNERPEVWSEQVKNISQFESGWSDSVIDNVQSTEEYNIYLEAGLDEHEVNGKSCLTRDDINYDQKDSMGRTNLERMSNGLAPLLQDGSAVELHHIGQHADSPLAELSVQEHRGKGNDLILHDKTMDSEIDRNIFNTEKINHWKARASEIEGGDL